MKPFSVRVLLAALLLASVALFVSGCKSTPKIDWNSRVGSFTYDQAVAELGPPDKSAQLSDGTTVAEWVTRRRGGSGLSVGVGAYGGSGGVGMGQTVGTGTGERVLRLIFDSEKRLKSWVQT
jgi:hypothetical protein